MTGIPNAIVELVDAKNRLDRATGRSYEDLAESMLEHAKWNLDYEIKNFLSKVTGLTYDQIEELDKEEN